MTDAANALIQSNRRRRSIRRWVAIGTIPITLAGLFFVGKLLSMYAFAHQSIVSFIVDDYAGSEASARGQELLNWFEPYKAPFNVGTALAGAEKLPEARAKLEEALTLARGLEVCSVRINLTLVVERMGDAARTAGDGARAAELYGEALQISAETPEECGSEQAQKQSSDPERDMKITKDETEDRLKQKQDRQQQQSKPDQGAEEPKPSENELDDLKKKLEQGTQERDEHGDEELDGSGTDKPW